MSKKLEMALDGLSRAEKTAAEFQANYGNDALIEAIKRQTHEGLYWNQVVMILADRKKPH